MSCDSPQRLLIELKDTRHIEILRKEVKRLRAVCEAQERETKRCQNRMVEYASMNMRQHDEIVELKRYIRKLEKELEY